MSEYRVVIRFNSPLPTAPFTVEGILAAVSVAENVVALEQIQARLAPGSTVEKVYEAGSGEAILFGGMVTYCDPSYQCRVVAEADYTGGSEYDVLVEDEYPSTTPWAVTFGAVAARRVRVRVENVGEHTAVVKVIPLAVRVPVEVAEGMKRMAREYLDALKAMFVGVGR